MNKKQIAQAALVAVLAIGVLQPAAMAAETTPAASADAAAAATVTQGAQIPDPFKGQIDAELTTLNGLRAEVSSTIAQIDAQNAANKAAFEARQQGTGKALKEQIQSRKDALKGAVSSTLGDLKTRREELAQRFTAAKQAGDKEQMASLKAEAEALKAEFNSAKQSLAGQRDELKGLIDQAKVQYQGLKGLHDQIKGLREQEKSLHSEIEALRAEKKSAWEGIHAAKQSEDWASVVSGLQTVNSLKGQILVKLQALLTVKQQIGAALTA